MKRNLKPNTIVRLPDGRIGTICYHHLDGYGGVWGQHHFLEPNEMLGNDLPAPEFMLRDKDRESSLRRWGHRQDMECVGEEYIILKER